MPAPPGSKSSTRKSQTDQDGEAQEGKPETQTAADSLTDTAESAEAYADQVKPDFDKVRTSIDKLEVLVDDKIWRLPKYRELLFIR